MKNIFVQEIKYKGVKFKCAWGLNLLTNNNLTFINLFFEDASFPELFLFIIQLYNYSIYFNSFKKRKKVEQALLFHGRYPVFWQTV